MVISPRNKWGWSSKYGLISRSGWLQIIERVWVGECNTLHPLSPQNDDSIFEGLFGCPNFKAQGRPSDALPLREASFFPRWWANVPGGRWSRLGGSAGLDPPIYAAGNDALGGPSASSALSWSRRTTCFNSSTRTNTTPWRAPEKDAPSFNRPTCWLSGLTAGRKTQSDLPWCLLQCTPLWREAHFWKLRWGLERYAQTQR